MLFGIVQRVGRAKRHVPFLLNIFQKLLICDEIWFSCKEKWKRACSSFSIIWKIILTRGDYPKKKEARGKMLFHLRCLFFPSCLRKREKILNISILSVAQALTMKEIKKQQEL